MANAGDNLMICPVCHGNGFIVTGPKYAEFDDTSVEQCARCDSQGEIQREEDKE